MLAAPARGLTEPLVNHYDHPHRISPSSHGGARFWPSVKEKAMITSGTRLHIHASASPRSLTRLVSASLVLLAGLTASIVFAGSAPVPTKADAVPAHFDHGAGGAGTRGGCDFGDLTPEWSGNIDVAIPDNQQIGTLIDIVPAPGEGLLLEYVQVELEIEHTYAGDLVLGLWYDQDMDGFGDVGPVYLMCTPGLAGCEFDGCCGCDGDLAGTYFINDQGAGPLGEVACTPVLAGGCYTPDSESPPLSIFQGLPDNGQFLLYAWDYEAGDVGVVHSYAVWTKVGCNHPNLDVPSVYGSITAAIEAACDGDTVRVQPGVYHEGVFFDHEISKALIASAVPGQRPIIDALHFDSAGPCPDLRDIEVAGDAYFRGGTGPRFATDCVFHGDVTYTDGTNNTGLGGVRVDGALSIDGGDAVLVDCRLNAVSTDTQYSTIINSCDTGALDIDVLGDGYVTMNNNTIRGAVVLKRYTEAVFTRNIVAPPVHGSTGVTLQPMSGATTGVNCNDVWNFTQLWSGLSFDPNGTSGNFSANPRFCDPLVGNYLLDAASPCAFGHHPQGEDCGLFIGAHPVGCSLPAAVGDAPLESMPLVTAQPNPSRGLVTFSLAAGSTPARIRIVDAAGRGVREIEVAASSAPRQATWDQVDAAGKRVASGVYFYRVQAGSRESTKRLVVLN